MRIIILITLMITAIWADKPVEVSKFKKQIKAFGLTFDMPSSYKSVAIKDNKDLSYDFAMKNREGSMEVRYSIIPLDSLFKEYEKSKKDENRTMINPNNLYKGSMQSNILNMTSGKGANIGYFPTQAVKREFHADIGGSAFFEFNSKFGEGYKYGQAIILHKDNVADVIITFLSNDKKRHADLTDIAFYALTFKPIKKILE